MLSVLLMGKERPVSYARIYAKESAKSYGNSKQLLFERPATTVVFSSLLWTHSFLIILNATGDRRCYSIWVSRAFQNNEEGKRVPRDEPECDVAASLRTWSTIRGILRHITFLRWSRHNLHSVHTFTHVSHQYNMVCVRSRLSHGCANMLAG